MDTNGYGMDGGSIGEKIAPSVAFGGGRSFFPKKPVVVGNCAFGGGGGGLVANC
jgi:hypothetical protein